MQKWEKKKVWVVEKLFVQERGLLLFLYFDEKETDLGLANCIYYTVLKEIILI